MCIMEITPKQHRSTQAQALFHNVSTNVSDGTMFRAILENDQDERGLSLLDQAMRSLDWAADRLLKLYAHELERHPVAVAESTLDEEVGNERWSHDRHLAQHHETRTEVTPTEKASLVPNYGGRTASGERIASSTSRAENVAAQAQRDAEKAALYHWANIPVEDEDGNLITR